MTAKRKTKSAKVILLDATDIFIPRRHPSYILIKFGTDDQASRFFKDVSSIMDFEDVPTR